MVVTQTEYINDNKVTYEIRDMQSWESVGADLVVVDPPFGIEFSGKESNYNRDESTVVDGYVEWEKNNYTNKINTLLNTIENNLVDDGQALILSGWNNSNIIHNQIQSHELNLEGKLYWSYNFAPYCSRRPAHNVYEVFWVTKNKSDWYYNNECSQSHCTDGEANLSHMDVKRTYNKDRPKYPTKLPAELVQIFVEHFSESGDVVFDPCAGSGIVGISAAELHREAVLGDLNKEALNVFNETVDYVGL